jgi:PAS domain S-box-containing protein
LRISKANIEPFHAVLENMREGIQILGFDWSYLFLNKAVIAQSHFTSEELIGHTLIEKYPGITETPFFHRLEHCMRERVADMVENEFTYPDGAVQWFALSIQPVTEGLLILSIDVTDRKRAEIELARRMQHERQLATRISLQAQEKERNEIGKELHDNINQILSTVKMYLEVLATNPDEWQTLAQRSSEYLNLAITEIRHLSHGLVAPSLGEVPLNEVLRGLAEDVSRLNSLEVVFEDQRLEPASIDTQQELMLYRIAQEQISNICKYSRATHARLILKTGENGLSFSIIDDGIGFNPAKNTRGIGLRNIRNRVEVFNGKLNIITAPQKGCTLEVILPVSP